MINKDTRETDRMQYNISSNTNNIISNNNTKSLYRMAMYRSLQNILTEYTSLLSSI